MPNVDGVLLVVGRRQVKQESVKNALEQLRTLKGRLVGVIVNRAEADSARVHFYEQHYRPQPQREARKAQPVPAASSE
jgi:Mrp family chromosome partitioning ATPase